MAARGFEPTVVNSKFQYSTTAPPGTAEEERKNYKINIWNLTITEIAGTAFPFSLLLITEIAKSITLMYLLNIRYAVQDLDLFSKM